jgi:hypothetical protein
VSILKAMSASPNRVLAVILGTVGVLAVTALALIALRPSPTFDPATPEGVVQGYLEAVFAGDETTAVGYIDPQSGCGEGDIARARIDGSSRAVLVDTDIDDSVARVEVEVTRSQGQGPFDYYEYSQDQIFDLVHSADRWLLTGDPWPVYACSGDTK